MTTFVIFMFWIQLFNTGYRLISLYYKLSGELLFSFLCEASICLWAAHVLGWIG